MILVLLCPISKSFGQKYNLTTLNLEDGLPSENVYDIMQDSEGYIWFATLSGMARYDGYDFRVFNDADGLRDIKMKKVVEYNGSLLALSWDKELYTFNGSRFELFMPKGLEYVEDIRTMEIDDKGWLWLGSHNGVHGVKGDSVRTFQASYFKEGDEIVIEDILRIDSTLWVVTLWWGTYKINLNDNSFIQMTVQSHSILNNMNYCIEQFDDGVLMLGGYAGVTEIDGDKVTKYELSGDPNINRVRAIQKDENGGYWFSLYGRGVMHWDKGAELLTIEGDGNIPSRYTYELFIDNENNKWVATEGGGAYMFNDLSLSIMTKDHGLSSANINAVELTADGGILLGTADGSIDYVKGDSIFTIPLKDRGSNLYVFDLLEKDGVIWAGTSTGVVRYDSGDYKHYSRLESGFEVANACYYSKRKDRLFFGSHLGYFEIDQDSLRFHDPFRRNGNVFTIDIRTINEDGKGTIWFAGTRNLVFLKDGKLKEFPHSKFRQRPILCSSVSQDGTIWFGGENLLSEVSYLNGDTILIEYNTRDMLAASSISAILFNGDDMWIGYDKGILRISLSELRNRKLSKMKRYSFRSGFPQSEISLGAMAMDNDGVIWAGTFKGLVKIDPAKYIDNQNIPKIVLDGIDLFSETVNVMKTVFDHDENYFNFRYKAFNYFQSGNIVYSYKLDGIDGKWSPATQQRMASYAYLPYGKYKFLVRAKYEDGEWSKPKMLYAFEIKAPFWKTWWFNLLILILILSMIAIYVMLRLRTSRLKELRSKEFSKSLLRAQEEERVRIARDLHDTVGQNLLYVSSQVKEMKTLPKLSEQIDTTITEIRQIVSAIHPMHIKNFGLSFALSSLVKKIEEVSELFVSSELPDTADQLFDDEKALHIFRIAQEAFNNIVKHSGASAASISVECTGQKFMLRIQDNGKGFDFDKTRSASVSSFGLTSMSERADLIGANLKVYKGKSKGVIVELTVNVNESSNS